jgi:hypothetical protein
MRKDRASKIGAWHDTHAILLPLLSVVRELRKLKEVEDAAVFNAFYVRPAPALLQEII